MNKFIFIISIFCLANQFQIKAASQELSDQDGVQSKSFKKNVIAFKNNCNSDKESKLEAEDEVDQNTVLHKENLFQALSYKYPKETKALFDALQSCPQSFPTELNKLIIEYYESENYEFEQSLNHTNSRRVRDPKIIQLSSGDLASWTNLLSDRIIKIWRKNSENLWNCIQILEGHEDWISSVIQLQNGDLISCDSGSVLKTWRLDIHENWQCIHTKKYDYLRSIFKLSNNDLAYITYVTLKVANQKSDCSLGLQRIGYYDDINSPLKSIIKLNNGDIASYYSNGIIKIWRYNFFKQFIFGQWTCIQTIHAHTVGVTSVIQLNNGNLVSSSEDKTIKIWHEFKNGWTCIDTLIGHKDSVLSVIQLRNGNLASCSADCTIKIWKPLNNSYECTETLMNLGVISLTELDNGDLVSTDYDKINICKRPFENISKTFETEYAQESHNQNYQINPEGTDIQNNNFVLSIVQYVKDNPIKVSTAIATVALIAKYRNHIAKLFRK